MKRYSLPRRYELPRREVFAVTRDFMMRHYPDNLRRIANEFDITKRGQFYEVAHGLADRYCIDKIIEDDLLHSTEAKVRFAGDIDHTFGIRHLYSMWSEPYFTFEGELKEIGLEFRRTEFSSPTLQLLNLNRPFTFDNTTSSSKP